LLEKEMNWEYYWIQFLLELRPVLPWLIGMFGTASILSFGPVGRALARRLRYGAEDAERNAALLDEVRNELAEILERLDAQERLLTGRPGERIVPLFPTPADAKEAVDTPT